MPGLLPILMTLAVVASLVFAAMAPPSDPSRLVAVAETSLEESSREVIEASLDGTPDDVPRLAGLLKRGTADQRAKALTALGYLGGDRAIAALTGYAGQTGDRATAAMLYFAMGARGTAADRRDLLAALQRKRSVSTFVAALALGVLRADEAHARLSQLAREDPHGYAGDAAALALTWLEQGAWQAEVPAPATDDDQIAAAIIRQGIPGVSADTTYIDVKHQGVWAHEAGRWHVRPGVPEGAGHFDPFGPGPTLDFVVHRSRDNGRALARVSVWYGPKTASGWDYVLTKRPDGWTVRGLMLAWVA